MNAVAAEGVWKFYGDYPALRAWCFTPSLARVSP